MKLLKLAIIFGLTIIILYATVACVIIVNQNHKKTNKQHEKK